MNAQKSIGELSMPYEEWKSSRFLNNNIDRITDLSLAAFFIYGIVCKFLISVNLSLNSDTVDPGIVSMEIWRHKDYLLKSFYFPAADPHIFSEILPFHLIPLVISNYDPLAIKVSSFFIYILVIAVYSYLIFMSSGSRTNALIFSAIMANIGPSSFTFYTAPVTHNAILFFTGLFAALFINREVKADLAGVLLILLLDLIIFSDSLIIALFVIPFNLYYVISFKSKTKGSNLAVFLMDCTGIATVIFKTFFIKSFITIPIQIKGVSSIIDYNMPLYIKGLLFLLNDRLYAQFLNTASFQPLTSANILIAASFLVIIFFTVKAIIHDTNNRINSICIFLLSANTIVLIGYWCTDLCVDFGSTRYLAFTALSIYVLIAMLRNKNHLVLPLIFILLVTGALSNLAAVETLDHRPNGSELDLIAHLKDENLTYGYGDYWDSNIVTYLSNEAVVIRPVNIADGELIPFRWLTSESWYSKGTGNHSRYFIVMRANVSLKPKDLESLSEQPIEAKSFGDYFIYIFANPHTTAAESHSRS